MTSDRQPLYEARNISKSYGSILALDDVSVRLYPGEVLGLVGDNGAGKSTLVKVLSGVHNPDSGQLLLDGLTVVVGFAAVEDGRDKMVGRHDDPPT